MAREKVLLGGAQSSSKSLTIVELAFQYPNDRVVVFDPDDGLKKIITEDLKLSVIDLMEDTYTIAQAPNFMCYPVFADLEKMLKSYDSIKVTLGNKDWMCFEMLGKLWDMCQQYYSVRVFGQNPIEHLLKLREQAVKIGFGGFDGLQDWSLIKRIHNELSLDDACISQKFNLKLEGEKHNPYRFDTIALLYRNVSNQYKFRMVKDRGRAFSVDTEYDITSQELMEQQKPGVIRTIDPKKIKNFWSEYRSMRGI